MLIDIPQTGASFTSTIHKDTYPFIASADLRGRHVFITGGTRGIGRAIAASFARSGVAAIAIGDIVDSDAVELREALQREATDSGQIAPRVLVMKLDVTDSSGIQDAAAQVKQAFDSKLDIIVNNAGFMTPALEVSESNEETWWRTFEVNLKGPYLITKYFFPLLLGHDESLKTMININSVASHNLRPMASAYGTSKLAVLRFTEFLLVEAASRGLVAYSIHPGGVLTELAEKGMPRDTLAALEDNPRLAGDTLVWLAQERREWLAGRYISSTWDMEELLSKKDEIIRKDLLKVRLLLD